VLLTMDPIVFDARRHLANVSARVTDLPDYGTRWQPQVEAMRRDIPVMTDITACLHYAQYNITFDGRPPYPGELAIQFREWAVGNEFPHLTQALQSMSENQNSGPGSLGQFHGRTVSSVMYYHARNVLAGITYANKPRRVVEVGGGYGEIARLWVTNTVAPAERYIIADIPESLFFAEVALRSEFGDIVGYFDGHDPGTRILLVPLPYLDRLDKPVDLVINTGSMQEMTDAWIDFYIDWLSRFDTRYFYSLNYVAQPLSIMGESRNLWTQRLGADWATRHLRLNIPLLDLEGPSRDYLEVLFEKTPATQSLKDWSVYRGRLLSKTTYVEGLDLLRQHFTAENAKAFLDIVLRDMPYHPKETLYIADWLTRQGQVQFESVRALLQSELGGMIIPAPAPPRGAVYTG
jgi:hypothetical protein